MAYQFSPFIEERQANRSHDCSTCRTEICPGEFYVRDACPPWHNGQGYWFIMKACHDCRRH